MVILMFFEEITVHLVLKQTIVSMQSRDRMLWRRDFNINELAAVES